MRNTITLHDNRDFVRMYRGAKSFAHPLLVAYVRKNKLEQCRMGITASKKIGKAVSRNRARRIIREAYRQLEPTFSGPVCFDFVFVARSKTTQVKTADVLAVMRKQLKNAGVLQ